MADDGTQYFPLNLGEEYMTDELRISFSGMKRDDVVTIAQWGISVELTSIRALDDRSGDHPTMEESCSIARDHVRNMDEYVDYGGRNLHLTDTETLRCPYCWQFTFEFDMISMKDPNVIDHAVVGVTVEDGKITEVWISCGMPEGVETVAEFLSDPPYEKSSTIIGRVSLLGELNCPCFELTSAGQSVEVWYDLKIEDDRTHLPPVSVEEIENGDIAIVTGMLKQGGAYHQKGVFWAENITKYS